MAGTPAAATSSVQLRLLTWNLRYDVHPDSLSPSDSISQLPRTIPADSPPGSYYSARERAWSTRRLAVAREVAFTDPAIFCAQEALQRQVSDLSTLLPSYRYVGVGREDGGTLGEYGAIFFDPLRVELQDWDTIWLSLTPFTPSKYPGAACMRTATTARFTTTTTPSGIPFTVICTHWDYWLDAQRRHAASLLLRRGAYELRHGPVFVLGDFNSPSSGPDSGGYGIMTGGIPATPLPPSFSARFPLDPDDGEGGGVYVDVGSETPAMGRSGHHATFTGFEETRRMDLKRIDFVVAMTGRKGGWEPMRYRVGENWWDEDGFASDHRPVWVDLVVKG